MVCQLYACIIYLLLYVSMQKYVNMLPRKRVGLAFLCSCKKIQTQLRSLHFPSKDDFRFGQKNRRT